jgi:hypothetical protein
VHIAVLPAAAPVAAPRHTPSLALAIEPAPRLSAARRDLLALALVALTGAVEPEPRPEPEGQTLRPVGPRAQG